MSPRIEFWWISTKQMIKVRFLEEYLPDSVRYEKELSSCS